MYKVAKFLISLIALLFFSQEIFSQGVKTLQMSVPKPGPMTPELYFHVTPEMVNKNTPFSIEWNLTHPTPFRVEMYNPKGQLVKQVILTSGPQSLGVIDNWSNYKIPGPYKIVAYNIASKPIYPYLKAWGVSTGVKLTAENPSELVTDYKVEPLKGSKEFQGEYNLIIRSIVIRQVIPVIDASKIIWKDERGVEPPGYYNNYIWKCVDQQGRRVLPDDYRMLIHAMHADNPNVIRTTKESTITVTP